MSAAEVLLARLDGVRSTGLDAWICKCPSHDDKTPSLSIRETNDGTVLVHDFGGCSPSDILASVGLQLADLFPQKLSDHLPAKRDKKHFHALREAFRSIHHDVLFVLVAAENIAKGVSLEDQDRDDLAAATARIRATIEVST